ncbi:hypothetical protein ASD15_22025 [Massilia sp. Root351]|nr:hypothetical protein ASD15_22025 [Massilia sp. Root351]
MLSRSSALWVALSSRAPLEVSAVAKSLSVPPEIVSGEDGLAAIAGLVRHIHLNVCRRLHTLDKRLKIARFDVCVTFQARIWVVNDLDDPHLVGGNRDVLLGEAR